MLICFISNIYFDLDKRVELCNTNILAVGIVEQYIQLLRSDYLYPGKGLQTERKY